MVLNDDQRREITVLLGESLVQDVSLVHFTQDKPSFDLPVEVEVTPCDYCEETKALLRELTGLSDKLNLEIYDFINDKDKVEQYGVTDVPATAIIGDKDYGIRYYGIPSGYEFSALLDAIIRASQRQTQLKEDTRQALHELQEPVHIKVFVTPT